MIERVLFDIAETRLARVFISLLNRLPCPGSRWPVNVYGHRMFANKNDRYGSLWLRKMGLVERFETQLVSQLCKPGMFVADVGANVGFYTLLFARRVGPSGRVWAFEPDPSNFAALQRNATASSYSNIVAINKAAGAVSKRDYLFLSDIHSGDHHTYATGESRRSVPIEVVALDDFFAPEQPIDLVKMDIQGSEGKALEGMSRILRSNPGLTILMEFWPMALRQAGSDPEKLLRDLQALGMVVELCDERTGKLRKVADPVGLSSFSKRNQYVNILVRRRGHD
jgi:FkbM family methyltransferase